MTHNNEWFKLTFADRTLVSPTGYGQFFLASVDAFFWGKATGKRIEVRNNKNELFAYYDENFPFLKSRLGGYMR